MATTFGTAVGHYPLSVNIHFRLGYNKWSMSLLPCPPNLTTPFVWPPWCHIFQKFESCFVGLFLIHPIGLFLCSLASIIVKKNTWNNQLIGNKSLLCSVLEVVWWAWRDSTLQLGTRSRRSYGVLGAWSSWNKREKEEHSSNVSFKCMLQLSRRSARPHLLESLLLANSSPKRIYPLTCGCLGDVPNES